MVESRKRAVLQANVLDFPEIAGGETAELTVVMDDARAGDCVIVGAPGFLDVGLIPYAYVNTANQVVVRLHNSTGAAIDPTAGAQSAVAAAGTLTIEEDVAGSEVATGTLTIGEPVTDTTDTLTIGSTVYRFMDTPAQAYDVEIGADEDATKVNIVAAINASGTEGVEYFAGTLIHPDVTAAAFATDDCIMSAKVEGTAANAIVFTETFTDGANVLDGSTTFGGTNAGVDGDTYTIGGVTYTFQEVFIDAVNNVFAGANEAAAKVNLVAAVNASGGTPGTTHFTTQVVNPDATAAAFSGDDAVVTATVAGFAGNSIATTETFADAASVFDAATLGDTVLGADAIGEEDSFWTTALVI